MLFNSLQFLVFFPIVFGVYVCTPHRLRWLVLLIASYYFYMSWKPAYVLLILCTSLVAYVAALAIHDAQKHRNKRWYVLLGLLVPLGILFFFKYYNFAAGAVSSLLNALAIPAEFSYLQILLPVGVSFYTFQVVSYVVDVYKQRIAPESHLGIFLLYVSFFPQLVAGPIERASHLLPQFYRQYRCTILRLQQGATLFLWGLVKKMVIADQAAVVVNLVYADVQSASAATLLLGTYAFAIQIYGDFSGYTDMALGIAKILGFDLSKNFKRPYAAVNPVDFWRRWHITLSEWFRDYVYIPLGGSRSGIMRQCMAVAVVFALSGLWHGANWTFVVWGLLHGALVVSYVLYRTFAPFRLWKPLAIFCMFHATVLTWVFFRASSLHDAVHTVTTIIGNLWYLPAQLVSSAQLLIAQTSLTWRLAVVVLCTALIVELVHYLLDTYPNIPAWYYSRTWLAIPVITGLILWVLAFAQYTQSPFIYFQF